MDSVILWAAFPVGAAKEIFRLGSISKSAWRMETSKKVLPVPGPPVITENLFLIDNFAAFN